MDFFNQFPKLSGRKKFWIACFCLLGYQQVRAQNAVSLHDLSFFDNPSSNWKVATGAQADITQDEVLTVKEGTGILVNLPGKKGAKDLFTKIPVPSLMVKTSSCTISACTPAAIFQFDEGLSKKEKS